MHFSSHDKMRAFRDAYLGEHRQTKLTILDVGSAAVSGETGSYRPLFAEPSWRYLGLDMQPGPNVDIVPQDPYRWEALADGSIDVVVSGQAFEHIEWPWLTIQEIARVLRGGGLAAIIAPSAGPVHRFPLDCWRYYPDGMTALARFAGLNVVETHWDQGYAWPENAFWGEACAILQQPRGIDPIFALTGSRNAIGRRAEERLRTLDPLAIRRQLLAETARRAWFIMRSPLNRLTRL